MSRLRSFLLALFLVILAAPQALADIIFMTDGTKRSGRIIEETPAHVKLQMTYAVITISRSDILRIQREKTKAEIHEEEWAKCKSAKDFYELGLKAREWDLENAAILDFQKAVEVDPDHEGARKALGFVRDGKGSWVTEEEYYQDKGFVHVDGRWVTPEEAETIIEERRNVLRKEADSRQAKFREALEGVEWARAHTIKTKHYVIRCNSTKAVAQEYADFMEQLNDAYSKVFGKYPKFWRKESTIYILRSHEEFMDMLDMDEYIGGFYRPGKYLGLPERIVCAFHGPFGDTSDTYDVLAHEATHQFEHMIMDGAQEGDKAVRDFMVRPDWIIEGLAVYFGDGHKIVREKKGKVRIEVDIPRDRLLPLQRWVRSGELGKHCPLKILIRIPHHMFSGAFYAPAWAFCHWMLVQGKVTVDGKEIDMKKVFEEHLQEITAPPPGNAEDPNYYAGLFEKRVGVSLDQLQKPFEDYIMSLKVPAIGQVAKGGNVYASSQMGAELKRPNKNWEFDVEEDLRPGEIVVAAHKKTSGRVAVTAMGNGMMMAAEDIAERMGGNFSSWLDDCTIKVQEPYFHKGFDGVIFEMDGKEKDVQTADIKPRKNPQRYRRIVLANLKTIYYLTMQADQNEFEGLEKDFKAFLDGFEILAIE